MKKKIRIEIQQDEYPSSPREWDNIGIMTCSHPNYNLSDEGHEGGEVPDDALVVLPLYLYDHSGITMKTTPFGCSWDSGQVGFIYATKESIQRMQGDVEITPELLERVKGYLKSEVKIFDDYLTGNVWGFAIFDGEEVLDSCHGFIGDIDDSGVMEEAKSIAQCYVDEAREKLKKQIKARAPLDRRVIIPTIEVKEA